MGTAEMVGSMGLTFFCNRCVEILYKFDRDGEAVLPDVKSACTKAIVAFRSLKWPTQGQRARGERVGLFNTSEEIRSFERLISDRAEAPDQVIDSLIDELESMVSDKPLNEKKETAKKLRGFFDVLGDYSFHAARQSMILR